jgi:AGZA family xanthine/uracil permease-like MFS transporter
MQKNTNVTATIGVFFDSFAKLAISISVLIGEIKLPIDLVYQQIIPSVCFGLSILGLAYYYQAKRLAKLGQELVTALPNGLQASCVFVWLFAIMLPIATRTHNPILAYKVALVANLLNAIIFSFVGILLIKFKRYIPKSALFSGLAGSALTWLALNNLPSLFEHPLSGLLPFLIILGFNLAQFKSRLPIVILGIISGTLIALVTGEFHWSFANTLNLVGFNLPHWYSLDFSPLVLQTCETYLPLIIAFAIIDAVSAVQVLEECRYSKDNFDPIQSILISGIISGASAWLGNPFAMALFYGHYSWKKSGANSNYVLYNSLIYALLGATGIASLLVGLIPAWVTLPILIVVGLTTTAISFSALDSREYILLVIGAVPIISELIYNKLELLALQVHITNFTSQPEIAGLALLAKGSILFGLLLSTCCYYVMYQRWYMAAISCVILSIANSVGLIHASTPTLSLFNAMNYVYWSLAFICVGLGYTMRFKNNHLTRYNNAI